MLLAVWHSFLDTLSTVSSFVYFGCLVRSGQPPNKALQLTANPLRGLTHTECLEWVASRRWASTGEIHRLNGGKRPGAAVRDD
jgi:hypothetical protein